MFNLKKEIKAAMLAETLGFEFIGNKNFVITAVDRLDRVQDGGLSFSKSNESVNFDVVLVAGRKSNSKNLIVSDNPRLDFIRCLEWLEYNIGFKEKEKTSFIHPTVSIGKNVVIEDNVSIGAGTIIEHNVVIHKGTKIGSNTIIRANTVVGAQGFGFEKNCTGDWLRFPHLGKVLIGDSVEIGALNSICVGALSDTIIENGVKTDNLVHIAHNCIVGENSIITACAELSGGVILENNVWIGPNSSIMQKVIIGQNSLVGLGSTVTKHVAPNIIVAGSPAKKIRNNN